MNVIAVNSSPRGGGRSKTELMLNHLVEGMRAAGADEALRLAPPREMTLDRALEWIENDELVEVTPGSLRLRKRLLDAKVLMLGAGGLGSPAALYLAGRLLGRRGRPFPVLATIVVVVLVLSTAACSEESAEPPTSAPLVQAARARQATTTAAARRTGEAGVERRRCDMGNTEE